MSIDNKLEFVDLNLQFDNVHNTISIDVYSKPTNSFTYVMPTTCYPNRNIENVPEGVALRLRRICDSDDKFQTRSSEYQQYFLARGYKPHKVRKQFYKVSNISREVSRQPKNKRNVTMLPLLTEYNPMLPDLNKLIRNRLPLLHSDPSMKELFPEGSVKALYKRGKKLKRNFVSFSISTT